MRKLQEKVDNAIVSAQIFMSKKVKGMGLIEVVLIAIVIIGLCLVFRDKLKAFLESLFTQLTTESNKLWTTGS